jgi:excisionase family DNA binding protein
MEMMASALGEPDARSGRQAGGPTWMERIAYTIDEVLELVGIGRTKLYEVIGTGELPVKKLGNRTLVLASDLDEWIARLPSTPIKKWGEGNGRAH